MKSVFCFVLFSFSIIAHAQYEIKDKLIWNNEQNKSYESSNSIPFFKNCIRNVEFPDIPSYTAMIDLPSDGTIQTQLIIIRETPKKINNLHSKNILFSNYQINTRILQERRKFKAVIELTPIRFASNQEIILLDEFEIKVNFIQKSIASSPAPPNTFISELSDGLIYKISIPKRGIYKITKAFFKDQLKVNADGLDPRNIRLLGNGGTRLPEKISTSRIDDLQENRIFFSGEDDGTFNDQDYILFYAEGPDKVIYNETNKTFSIDKNPYSDKSYYFIKLDNKKGLRIPQATPATTTEYNSGAGLGFYHHEKEIINLLDDDECNHGSGQIWYGEELSNTRNLDLSSELNLQDILLDKPVKIKGEFAARSSLNSNLKLNFNRQSKSYTLGASSFSCTTRYASSNPFEADFAYDGTTKDLSISFPNTSVNSEGWLNYLTLNFSKLHSQFNEPVWIFDPEALNKNTSYKLSNFSSKTRLFWDITIPSQIRSLPNAINSKDTYNVSATSELSTFLCFSTDDNIPAPEFNGLVDNQNIHGLDKLDLLLIYHKSLKEEAERLLKHRTTFSKLSGAAVDIEWIYNEFGSGSPDPTAVRDFAKMLYTRNPNFKYITLFGTASYDYRHLSPNTKDYNLVPTYETAESLDPILAFPSDDYFGLLDDNEGENLIGLLDLEIGRILARTTEEARIIVDKIVRYDTEPKLMGDWKLNIVFSADDEDGNAHISDVESLAISNKSNFPIYNQQKIYLDAFEQISTPGGERYPEANKAINDEIFRGAFVMAYLGHGGPTGLAQERVLQENDIRLWENELRSPLMITATCSFTPYDDPRIYSAGQQTQAQKNGTVAIYSTVRAVYANENYRLTNETLEEAFKKTNNSYPTLGDMLRVAKNNLSTAGVRSDNNRKYGLFGDPAQKLAYPDLETEVTSVNGQALSTQDTFKALQKIQIKGVVKANNGQIKQDFNGKLYITIFDKAVNLKTRGNNGNSPFNYSLQRNIIFKGITEVKNGEWISEFTIPKDINYVSGQGKISLYATDEKELDAAGFTDKFVIGGFSKDAEKDDVPPVVKLFINNNDFVNGGICNENPKIYAEISDDYGINITGNSIGHDLVAILDGNDQNPIVLNTFFKSKLNSAKDGNVEYPLKNLSVGKHTLSLVAWDISNNRGLGNIEFNVISSDDVSIQQVYNYPNPFNKKTNFQFEMNYINLPTDITVQIQSLSGKIVKTIQEKITPTGYRITDIEWDGKDDNGSELANGVYLYRIGVHHSSSELIFTQKSDFQKLVILK